MRAASFLLAAALGLAVFAGWLSPVARAEEHEVMFIRHGKSAGNAGKFWQAADGTLTDKGKKQAIDGAIAIRNKGQGAFQHLCGRPDQQDKTIYMLSPLRRAVATFVLFYMHACRAGTTLPLPPPGSIKIVQALREKRKSSSEDVNAGWKGTPAYVKKLVNRYCAPYQQGQSGHDPKRRAERLNIRQQDCDAFANAVVTAYTTEFPDTANRGFQLSPKVQVKSNEGFWFQQLRGIDAAMQQAIATGKTHMVMVAHSGVGRSRFSCFLPQATPKTDQAEVLASGVRTQGRLFGNGEWIRLKLNANGDVLSLIEDGITRGAPGKAPLMAGDNPGAGPLPTADKYVKECVSQNVIPASAVYTKIEEGLQCVKPKGWFNGGAGAKWELHKKFNTRKPCAVHLYFDGTTNTAGMSYNQDFGGKKMGKAASLASCVVKDRSGITVAANAIEVKCGKTAHKFWFANPTKKQEFKTKFELYKNAPNQRRRASLPVLPSSSGGLLRKPVQRQSSLGAL